VPESCAGTSMNTWSAAATRRPSRSVPAGTEPLSVSVCPPRTRRGTGSSRRSPRDTSTAMWRVAGRPKRSPSPTPTRGAGAPGVSDSATRASWLSTGSSPLAVVTRIICSTPHSGAPPASKKNASTASGASWPSTA
jgi:hypothetical protein